MGVVTSSASTHAAMVKLPGISRLPLDCTLTQLAPSRSSEAWLAGVAGFTAASYPAWFTNVPVLPLPVPSVAVGAPSSNDHCATVAGGRYPQPGVGTTQSHD